MTDLIEAELVDLGAWTAASDARRAEIVQRTLSALPEFELVGLKDYQIDGVPSDRPIPIATFCHKDSGILFNLVPGGTFVMGFSDRQENALLTGSKAPEAELGPDDHFFVNSMLADPSGMRPAHSVTI